jgi:hypothetical protein
MSNFCDFLCTLKYVFSECEMGPVLRWNGVRWGQKEKVRG